MRIPAADKAMAFIGYMPLLPFWILPVWLRKESMFAQFHGRQSGVLWSLWAAICLLLTALLFVLPENVQIASSVLIFGVMFTATFVYIVMTLGVALLKVLPGERYRMPIVAGLALRFNL